MTIPPESQWERVEEMVDRLRGLEPECAEREMEALKESGEAPSVLNLARRMLLLPALPQPLQEGDVLAERYTLREKLGEGAMGAVWRATHGVIGHDVAVKMLHFGLVAPELASRFQGEMEILGRLEHRGIVRIVDAGIHRRGDQREIPYLAMDLVHGMPLNRWAAEHRGELGAILHVAQEVCAAVQHAHDRKIIHRDLKPPNILVRADGAPVILDFGLARAAGVPEEDSGLFCGTPEYAAPEQFFGNDRGFRSGESVDVYAVGAILFEMLAGRRLFEFSSRPALAEMSRILSEERPARLAALLPGCPPLLDEVVARAVRRDPADRYYSIGEFARALSRVASSIEAPAMADPPRWVPTAGAMVPGSQWRLQSKLGVGSSGEVWLGKHEELDERCVFKFCDSLEKVHTLKRELTLYRMLKEKVGQNPHFIPLHEVSLEEPPWYLMMDYVDALDLEAWCTCQPGGPASIPQATCAEIVEQVAEALQAAHESGILHRDIKPPNILVSTVKDGDGPSRLLVRVADFGIGQIVADELQRSGTRPGFTRTLSNLNRFSGTLLYMAPEVLEGGEATARSDVYSLGVVFWQLLSGNLHSALDPEGWAKDVADPLIREDLRRCLTRVPGKRWSSAGEFAASLRALPERRVEEARRQAELAARERAAYRRGALRTAAVAGIVVAAMAGLVHVAVNQRREAQQARARGALEQAQNLLSMGHQSGRSKQGLALLKEAAAVPQDAALLRTLAAGFGALSDLEAVPIAELPARVATPAQPGETVRLASASGKYLAAGHDANGLDGFIRFLDPADGHVRATFERKDFPLVPIPEPGFVHYSPDEKLLAVAGPETSLHVLLCRPESADLQSYIFVRGGLKSLAWHPRGRIVATGCVDHVVRLWDIESARVAASAAEAGDFRLPPKLDAPAIDNPVATLEGWRGSVCSVVFDPAGYWLAGLDDAGWLRIWAGFIPTGLPGLPAPSEASMPVAFQSVVRPSLMLETRLDGFESEGRLTLDRDRLVVTRPGGEPLVFRIKPGELFREAWISPGLQDLAWATEPGASTLCAITSTDTYWIARDTLKSRVLEGRNPAAVAYDATTRRWALPKEGEFCFRWPTEEGFASTEGRERWKLAPAVKGQTSRIGLASTADGRLAIFFAKRLQFASEGKPEPISSSVVTGADGGEFRELLWDRRGTTATVVYATKKGLRAESFGTSGGQTQPLGEVSISAQRLAPAGDGTHLIARSVGTGIHRVHAASGKTTPIDSSKEAKQDAPLAVSADGKWIAAVANRNVIRLIDAESGTYHADLTCPRPTTIALLTWHPSGNWLAALTEDGFVQVYSLAPWRAWLEQHTQAR
jgi:serine/threonine protein kinase/WD40 repeat protein